jgi:hypothetical protein
LQNGGRHQYLKLALPPALTNLGGRAGWIQQRCHENIGIKDDNH